MTRFPRRIFTFQADVYPAASVGTDRDASGGRGDDSNTPTLTGVPCVYNPLSVTEAPNTAMVAGKKLSHVYFRFYPGDLRTGSRIVITHQDGVALPRPIGLSVLQCDREGARADVTIWRADCQGRA
jgi:hypothetical protein